MLRAGSIATCGASTGAQPERPEPLPEREKGGPDEPTDHALGRSRGGFGTKFHLVCDGRGNPLAARLSPGQRHDSQLFEETLNAVKIPEPRLPARLAADKAYSSSAIRGWLRERDIEDVIPTKSNEERNPDFDKEGYRYRNVVERCISWLKESRRATRSWRGTSSR